MWLSFVASVDDVPHFLSSSTDINEYLCTNDYSGLCSQICDEPWKEVSDGSDSGIDSKWTLYLRVEVFYSEWLSTLLLSYDVVSRSISTVVEHFSDTVTRSSPVLSWAIS